MIAMIIMVMKYWMVVQLLTCDRQTSKTHQRPTLEQECFLIKRPNEDYRSVIHLKHLMK